MSVGVLCQVIGDQEVETFGLRGSCPSLNSTDKETEAGVDYNKLAPAGSPHAAGLSSSRGACKNQGPFQQKLRAETQVMAKC